MGVKISFKEFVKNIHTLEECVKQTKENDETFEYFLDLVESKGLSVEDTTTGDIATVTLPLVTLKRKMVYETAPPDKEIEDWILKMKPKFKKEYGSDWEQILYALSWKKYNKKHKK